MPHPNDDFIKKFLGESARAPQPKPEIAKKQKQQNYEKTVKGLLETTRSAILPSEVKRTLQKQKIQEKPEVVSESVKFLTEKLANEPKTKIPSKIQSKLKELYEQMEGIWQPQILPQGLFYHNKMTGQWMNTFGIIKNKLDEFLSLMDESSGDGSRVVPSPPVPPNPITLVKVLSFSDEGSYLAGYAEDTEENGYINVYSLNYGASVTPTLEHTITLGGITFDGATGQRCLVSESGEYVVLASPDIKTVYFFDASGDSLLQTITEDYPQFGEKIAADKDFYGMAISTNELTRSADPFDGSLTSYSISSPICYYRRNFRSSSTQNFKKIHTSNSFTFSRSNGFASLEGVIGKINGTLNWGIPQTGSYEITTGVNRIDDVVAKGYNYGHASISLESDNITYRAKFPNFSNSKYDILKTSGFTFTPSYGSNMFYKAMTATGGATYSVIPPRTIPWSVFTDDFLANQQESNFFMMGTSSVKNFSIVRKINNEYIYDSSYSDTFAIQLSYLPLLNETTGNRSLQRYYSGYAGGFMDAMSLRDSFYPTSPDLLRGAAGIPYWDRPEREGFIREEIVEAKLAINANDVYSVNKAITKSKNQGTGVTATTQNLNLEHIRIYRLPATNQNQTDAFGYNDYQKVGTGWTHSPQIEPYGLVKVMFKAADRSDLNVALNDSHNFYVPSFANLLDGPPSCPDSEFGFTASSSILSQNLQNAYVSNDRFFVNFDTTTMVFIIDNTKIYKPVIFETTLTPSLYDYAFTYNDGGEFFTKNKNIYKYNRTTNVLDLVGSLEI